MRGGRRSQRRFELRETDDYSYNVVENPVHIHDQNATILHCLGIDHEKLTYRFQGRDYRLTGRHFRQDSQVPLGPVPIKSGEKAVRDFIDREPREPRENRDK